MKQKNTPLTMLSFYAPDLREQIEAIPEGTAFIGISTTGQAITVDLDSESPHVLVCTASGGSTTTTVLRSLTAQFLHQGAHALALDPKRISHLWAKALPTVTHRGNVAGIHDALLGLAEELKRRNALADVPRLIVAMHSANATLSRLARYWETFRSQDDPKTSPAITALEEALWSGRAAPRPRHPRRHAPDQRPRSGGLRTVRHGDPSRPPTAFQNFLDQHGIPRSKSWRTLGTWPQPPRSPTESSSEAVVLLR
ncbi:hypothetical protein AB0K71_33505 [Streptomyces syringium]|uniref:hypothetical protein n=1 Tax=Streptomyces syringium TaxID=76729 RepID=UPI003440E1E6